QAVRDEYRSGRPRKLSNEQQTQLKETLRESPTEVGYNAPAWTPALVQQYLVEVVDVEYSRPSCRRLLKEAGLSYQKPRRTVAQAEAEDRDGFDEETKESGGRWTPR